MVRLRLDSLDCLRRDGIGFVFLGRILPSDLEIARSGGRGAFLLDHVGNFMRQQTGAFHGMRSVTIGREHNVAPYRVGKSVYRRRRACGQSIGVYAHVAEIASESGFEVRARRVIERPARGAQYVVNNWGSDPTGRARRGAMQHLLKHAADIRDVWSALGGGELKHGRGRAFWRSGSGFNVALDPVKGCWFDHRDNVDGDVVQLVTVVQGCDFKDAITWLSDFTGMATVDRNGRHHDRDADTDWQADLRCATWWRIAAEALAEECLEQLPSYSMYRYPLTQLLRVIRLGDAAAVAEYRAWRKAHPKLTSGLVKAGQLRDARLQKRLALWLRRFADAG